MRLDTGRRRSHNAGRHSGGIGRGNLDHLILGHEEETKGDGRANLFQNGEARAVDFSFDCDQKLRASFGYETYMAKWKKPGQELVLLVPVFGKSNSYFTCNLKTDVKDFAYASKDGKMNSEPVEAFKKWMANHDYDPEHGKDTPKNLPRDQQQPAAALQPKP